MKAKRSRLIPRKHTEGLVLLTVSYRGFYEMALHANQVFRYVRSRCNQVFEVFVKSNLVKSKHNILPYKNIEKYLMLYIYF